MSDEDRARWDDRYAAGAYAERTHPSALLADWVGPGGRALDVAAGAGRNAAFLATRGYDVVALDVSPVGLARARKAQPDLDARVCDLDDGLPDGLGRFDLIVVVRYLNLPLMPALVKSLAPGGRLVAEVLLQAPGGVGPSSSRFRAPPGALAASCAGLHVQHTYEGVVQDPDGREAWVAQLVGVI